MSGEMSERQSAVASAARAIYDFTAPSKRARMNDLLFDYRLAVAASVMGSDDGTPGARTDECICTDEVRHIGCPVPGHGWGATRVALFVACDEIERLRAVISEAVRA